MTTDAKTKAAAKREQIAQERAFKTPANARKVSMKSGGAVFYLYDNAKGKPCVIAFKGNSSKVWKHHSFIKYRGATGADARAKWVAETIGEIDERERDNAKRKKERNRPHNLEPGVIFVSSWGYDQTNVDFYEVVEVPSPCFVIVEKIGSQMTTGNDELSMSGRCMPDPKNRSGQKGRYKIDMSHRPSFQPLSCAWAYVWDGKSKHVSWYA